MVQLILGYTSLFTPIFPLKSTRHNLHRTWANNECLSEDVVSGVCGVGGGCGGRAHANRGGQPAPPDAATGRGLPPSVCPDTIQGHRLLHSKEHAGATVAFASGRVPGHPHHHCHQPDHRHLHCRVCHGAQYHRGVLHRPPGHQHPECCCHHLSDHGVPAPECPLH